MKTKKQIAEAYFTAWNTRKTEALRPLFSEGITLEDWEIYAEGIENVLVANQKIFDAVPSIEAIPLMILTDDENDCAVGVLKIKLPSETIDVIDVIKVDSSCKIISIKAYRGH
tara:strand:+ start:7038 stop:7376 length:339 start_codon:yes stop_codon:yes gene_type:complete